MTDIKKEEFAFSIYNQLTDEYGMIDYQGQLARGIGITSGEDLDKLISWLKQELLRRMKLMSLQKTK